MENDGQGGGQSGSDDGVKYTVYPMERLEYLESLAKESDRGCLLVGISEIDHWLGAILLRVLSAKGGAVDAKWLLDPKAGNRPLGSLAMRTRIAFALGLIEGHTRKALDALRDLRNEHAHGTKDFSILDDHVDPLLAILRDHFPGGAEKRIAMYKTRKVSNARAKLNACMALVLAELQITDFYLEHHGTVEPVFQVESGDKGDNPGVQ